MPRRIGARRLRRPIRRTKRVLKRRAIVRRPMKSAMNVHHFKYTALIKNYLTVEMNGSDTNFARAVTIQDINNYAELTALFDMYRINGYVFKLKPRQNTLHYQTAAGRDDGGSAPVPNTDFGGTNLFGSSNFGTSETCTVIDYDDDTNPANLGEIVQYATFKATRGLRTHSRYVKPRIKIDASNTGVLMTKRWLDCDNINIKHYGIKGTIANVPNISPPGTSDHPVMYYDLELVIYISFKNTK